MILCSDDHFSVDGTLIESMASMKNFRPKDELSRDDEQSSPHTTMRTRSSRGIRMWIFHGTRRSNETHCSRTDPEARLYRKGKGKPSQLAHMGHLLTENCNGLIMNVDVTEANDPAEREPALNMLDRHQARHGRGLQTLGADAGYAKAIVSSLEVHPTPRPSRGIRRCRNCMGLLVIQRSHSRL